MLIGEGQGRKVEEDRAEAVATAAPKYGFSLWDSTMRVDIFKEGYCFALLQFWGRKKAMEEVDVSWVATFLQ
ncbi:hypothetical protein RJT34_32964 [Clitoria ternatea]|uniref:Uncharacterized protein n=1 Tax=Clitoria ternatea TaxID=43366 RepID=A0AAN9I6E2_CLITE